MQNNIIRDALKKIEYLCDTSGDGIFVVTHNPLIICDSVQTWFWLSDDTNKIYIEFLEDELADLTFDVDAITTIKFEQLGSITTSHILLKDGRTITIHTNASEVMA